jgi:hypothetical protein
MKTKQYQPAFVRGELSPNMIARKDTDSYGRGAKKLRNIYVSTQGGAYAREGTRYVATVPAASRLVSFAFNTEQEYMLVFSAGQFRVYKDDVLQATVNTAPINLLTASQLAKMKTVQSADTLLLFHVDFAPIRITRTSHTVWTAVNATLINIPAYNYGSGPEPVISATRGWPQCGAFYEGRLWMGGLKSRPQTLLASRIGNYFDFGVGTGLDDEAINVTIDDDRVNAVLSLFPGRTLFILTTGGEFGVTGALGDPVTPSKIAQQLSKLTPHGSSDCQPLSVDGAVLFAERSGYVIRRLVYDNYEESYTAKDMSVQSSHLIRKPVRMDARSATVQLAANYTYVVNEDGTMAVLNMVESQSLIAWTLFETDGSYKDVAVLNGKNVYVLVDRVINNLPVTYLEVMDPNVNVDCAVIKTRQGFVNGDFLAGLTGWSTIISGDGTVQMNGQVCDLTRGTGVAGIQQALTLEDVEYELLLDVVAYNINNYGYAVVQVGTTSGGSEIITARVPAGLQSAVRFTPPAVGLYYVSVRTENSRVGVDNLSLNAKRWKGLNVLESKPLKAVVNERVAEDTLVVNGEATLNVAGNTLQAGLNFAPLLVTLPPFIADQTGNNKAGEYSRLVSVNLDLFETQEVIIMTGKSRYKPQFRRFNTDAITAPQSDYTGWKLCYLAGVARDAEITITRESPVKWTVLAVNITVGV